MITSKRFERAISKLYTAFHDNNLNPEDCQKCAVGNILDNKDFWKHITNMHGSTQLNYVGLVHQNLGKRFNGYTPKELLEIEVAFLKGCGYRLGAQFCHKPDNYKNKDVLFIGLCEVVSKLCQLDNIGNVMDCTLIFKYHSHDYLSA